MSDSANEWVLYHPPKSASFGHLPRQRDPRLAWPATQAFLADLTEYQFNGGRDGVVGQLSCEIPTSEWIDPHIAEARIKESHHLFGPPVGRFEPFPVWEIREPQLADAIGFCLDDDQYPRQKMGPTRLSISYRFVWKDWERLPYFAGVADDRSRQSLLNLYFGHRRLFIQPTFIFPAPWNSGYLRDFITDIESVVPFQFRDAYFHRSLLPAKPGGKRGRMLKLGPDWRRPFLTGPALS